MGHAIFSNLVLADNLVAGFEVEEDMNAEADMGSLDGALIIGMTHANNDLYGVYYLGQMHGVIVPRTERYWIKNVCFANFVNVWNFYNGIAAAPIGTCSHCFSDKVDATDAGARTTFFVGIEYDTILHNTA